MHSKNSTQSVRFFMMMAQNQKRCHAMCGWNLWFGNQASPFLHTLKRNRKWLIVCRLSFISASFIKVTSFFFSSITLEEDAECEIQNDRMAKALHIFIWLVWVWWIEKEKRINCCFALDSHSCSHLFKKIGFCNGFVCVCVWREFQQPPLIATKNQSHSIHMSLNDSLVFNDFSYLLWDLVSQCTCSAPNDLSLRTSSG